MKAILEQARPFASPFVFSHDYRASGILAFAAFFLLSALASFLATRFIMDQSGKRHILARTNERSLHAGSVPVGGGWAIIIPTIAALLFLRPDDYSPVLAVIVGALVLALLSWLDDRHDMPRLTRLGAQAAAIALVLGVTPPEAPVFSAAWPLWADRLLTGLFWLWFVNLFNFMDGLDGLAGSEIMFICLGLAAICLAASLNTPLFLVLAVMAGAAAGFLWWNRHPAKIFMGDVGSIPVGFILGWLLVELARAGHLAAAFLLPGYFLADATLTLFRRIWRRERFWQAHRSHFYQRAAMGRGSHSPVLRVIIIANAALLILSVLSLSHPLPASAGGFAVMAATLGRLRAMENEGEKNI